MNGQEAQPQSGPYYNVNPAAPGAQAPPQQSLPQKRKGDEDPPASGQRAKRNRYITIACNECKRRKIKCNGETPCQRCGSLGRECIYVPNCGFKDSQEFRDMSGQIRSLQESVNELWAHINALRGGPAPYAPQNDGAPAPYRNAVSPTRSRGSHTPFQGPTSSQYNFNVAKSSLQTMGITTEPDMPEDGGGVDIDPSLGAPHQQQAPMAPMVTHTPKDPLWQLGKHEAIRLCQVYEEEMGMMYPMLDINKVVGQAASLFDLVESARGAGYEGPELPGSEHIPGNDMSIIKMVIANGLLVEAYGHSGLAQEIHESCREAFESNLSRPVEIKRLTLLVIVAEYYFQSDDEGQAYRLIGLATRLCVEIGLHRRQTLLQAFPDDEQRSWVIKLFWSIYVLDRRWSLGMGRPFALQDSDIDPLLPQPANAHPYLTAMISYSQLASKVWQSAGNTENFTNEIDREQIGHLDREICQWSKSLPDILRFHPSSTFQNDSPVPRGERRLQVILYLRTNQMLTQVYRPILHSATSIMENFALAQRVVDVAKDTVKVLTQLNERTDIYKTQEVCFNYFLVTAVGVLFLASTHAPVEFSHLVRDEFYQALEIVKGFTAHSFIGRRLWQTIKNLKGIGPQLGLISRQTKLTNADDPHSSAAVAMAGLAGHPVDEMAAYANARTSNSIDGGGGGSPMNGQQQMSGQQMSYELTQLFEAAGGRAAQGGNSHAASGRPVDATNGYKLPPGEQHPSGVPQGQDGYGADVSRILGGLF